MCIRDRASNRRFKSTADVLETVLADSASEDEQSVESSSTSDQSSAESSAGDEDVDNGQSSGRKRKVARRADVDGGWADNTSYDNVNPLVFTGNSVCVTPLQCEQLLLFFEQFVTADFVSNLSLIHI